MNALLLHPFVEDLVACLRFYTLFEVPWLGDKAPEFRGALRAVPVAGAIIGACGGAALFVTWALGIPPLPASACAIATLVAATGALHEDGLADVADGFGGGGTRQRKLDIMRDSQLGSFGAVALALALMLRVFALAALTERGLPLAVLSLICAGAVSRTGGLAPLLMLASARSDGAGAAMSRPSRGALQTALLLALALSMPLTLAGMPLSRIALGDILALFAAILVAKLAERQIGGFTGDVLGMAQQSAEIVVLLALCRT
jgi:adenosylcobinamide-GDP ribazoletransferase